MAKKVYKPSVAPAPLKSVAAGRRHFGSAQARAISIGDRRTGEGREIAALVPGL